MMINPLSERQLPPNPDSPRQTALHDCHVARNAKMVTFAGWHMPLQYGKVMDEHHAVREAAGLFDISHMGLVVVSCGDVGMTRAFLNRLVPRDLEKLYPGKAFYTQFLNEGGGILDDVIVYEMPTLREFEASGEFLIVCNAANTMRDIAWIESHAQAMNCSGLTVHPLDGRYSFLALQGPRFADILARTGYEVDHLPARFHIAEARIQGTPVLISRTGYTGEDGVELIIPNDQAEQLWNLLLDLGRPHALQPIGLGARDTLRLEAAYPLHGHDISEEDTPLEAGLAWSVRLDKPTDFIGKAALLRQQQEGLSRELYCFTLNQRMIARQHDIILKDGVEVGRVTSGSISPLYNVPIGMGYIRANTVFGPGDTIQVRIRGKDADAEIVERPFYQK